MNNKEQTIWQLSAGTASRTYADIFIKYSVGLIGPGDAGPWKEERDDSDFEGSYVRRFASEAKIGDIFLLRSGIFAICAVGIVASDYEYFEQFDDVNGLDLQHGRRVRWCKLPEEYTFENLLFGANPPRFSRVWNEEVIDYAKRFLNSPPTNWQQVALPTLPVTESELHEIPSYLQGLIAEVRDIYPLLWDRQNFGEHPTEDELVAHFVVPYLHAAGWPTERIAIKWRYVDVAIFNSLPRIPENCQFIIEAKRLGAGVEGALDQAKGYVRSLDISCDIIVTDGIRYRLYSCKKDFEPIAYANLARLKMSALTLFNMTKR